MLIITIVALFIVRSVVANEISTSGVALGVIEDETKRYKTENTLLKEQINDLSSLAHIASSAGKLGFSQSKSNIALKRALPIALGQ